MMNAEQPEIVGASALQELQIAGVIDPAGKIRVLEIDALAKLVTTVREPAGDRIAVLHRPRLAGAKVSRQIGRGSP